MQFNLFSLQNTPIGQFAIPFVFVTTVVFGILSISPNLKFDKNIQALISAIIGLFATSYRPVNQLLWQWMPLIAVALILLFFFKIVTDILKPKEPKKEQGPIILVFLILLMFLIGVFGSDISRYFNVDSNNLKWGLGIIIFILIVYFGISKSEKSE